MQGSPEQSRDLWELRLACAGTPSWFATHFALWVVAPTVNGDPVPPRHPAVQT